MGVVEYLSIYIIFALTTGLASCYEIMRPAIFIAKNSDKPSVLAEQPYAHYFAMFIIGTLFAPFTIFTIFSSSLNEAVIEALLRD